MSQKQGTNYYTFTTQEDNGKLHSYKERLFQTTDNFSNLNNDQRNSTIAIELNSLYKLLDLSPYDNEGVFHQSRYKQVRKEIEPA